MDKSFSSGFLCHLVQENDIFKVTGAESLILRKLAKAFQEIENNIGEGRPLDYSRRNIALAYELFRTSTAPPRKVYVYMCVYACI